MYFFYIDESGKRDVNVDEPYVLAAVGMHEGRWRDFNIHLMGMKMNIGREYDRNIRQDQLEVKANLLTKPKAREGSDFFKHLDDKDIAHISEHYLWQLERSEMVIIAVIVQKNVLQSGFTFEQMHKKAYEILLERIQHHMEYKHEEHNALIIMDDTGGQLNRKVTSMHSRLLGAGNNNMKFSNIIEYPFFVSSEFSNGVQLADVIAYTVLHTFKYDKPEYEFMKRIHPYIARHPKDKNKLAGLKIWPNEAKAFKKTHRAIQRNQPNK